jgi:hypothetical protein
MDKKPLYSSKRPIPETGGRSYGVILLAAAILIIVMLGTAMGSGVDLPNQSSADTGESGTSPVIPDTGPYNQESIHQQRQSVKCSLGVGACPTSEADDG